MELRVWWMPQVGVPEATFYVPVHSVEEAKKVMDILAYYDCFQYNHKIKPDYSNCGGLQMLNSITNEWVDWELEGDHEYYDDVDDYIANKSKDAYQLQLDSQALARQVSFE